MMQLIIDNTVDPTVPHDIAANDAGDMPVGVALAIEIGMAFRRLGFLGWIALGVCVGVMW